MKQNRGKLWCSIPAVLQVDPGGSTGHLRVCTFLGTWRTLLCGEVFVRALDEAAASFGGWMTRSHHLAGEIQEKLLPRTYCGRSLFLRSQAGFKMSCRQRRHKTIKAAGVNECKGTPWSEELDGKELHGALGGECDLEPRESAVSWTSPTWSTHPSTSTTSAVLC